MVARSHMIRLSDSYFGMVGVPGKVVAEYDRDRIELLFFTVLTLIFCDFLCVSNTT